MYYTFCVFSFQSIRSGEGLQGVPEPALTDPGTPYIYQSGNALDNKSTARQKLQRTPQNIKAAIVRLIESGELLPPYVTCSV